MSRPMDARSDPDEARTHRVGIGDPPGSQAGPAAGGHTGVDGVAEGRRADRSAAEGGSPVDSTDDRSTSNPEPAALVAGSQSPNDPGGPVTPDTVAVGRDDPVEVAPDRRTVLTRQRERFGGPKIGSAFFGWLAATGLLAILLTVLAEVGSRAGWVDWPAGNQPGPGAGDRTYTFGVAAGIVLLVVVFVSYAAGGYVAGRMARFNGAKQGLVVWLWGIVMAAVIAVLFATVGSTGVLVGQLVLPRFRMAEEASLGTDVLGIVIVAVVALAGAILGGLAGMRFHRRVDRLDVLAGDRQGSGR